MWVIHDLYLELRSSTKEREFFWFSSFCSSMTLIFLALTAKEFAHDIHVAWLRQP